MNHYMNVGYFCRLLMHCTQHPIVWNTSVHIDALIMTQHITKLLLKHIGNVEIVHQDNFFFCAFRECVYCVHVRLCKSFHEK